MSMVAATSAVVEAAPAGLATGLFNAARQVGSALGIAVLGALLAGVGVRFALAAGAAGYLAAILSAPPVRGMRKNREMSEKSDHEVSDFSSRRPE
ncbi:hypothetical protein ABT369_02295 [Dactylosporangium sp. NPDC000244]|uniref:hypothetical protein n=1 Tax=Dactylosporangium sp. NPDC000244 TaxID=3154365 RepID=UPI0033331D02